MILPTANAYVHLYNTDAEDWCMLDGMSQLVRCGRRLLPCRTLPRLPLLQRHG